MRFRELVVDLERDTNELFGAAMGVGGRESAEKGEEDIGIG